MSQNILKSKKFQYAFFFISVSILLAVLPAIFNLNPQVEHGLRLAQNGAIVIALSVIGGHSLTDAVTQYVNRPQFKELVSEISPVLEAAGVDQEVQDTILSFLKENGVTIE